jgi:hypothetical protein
MPGSVLGLSASPGPSPTEQHRDYVRDQRDGVPKRRNGNHVQCAAVVAKEQRHANQQRGKRELESEIAAVSLAEHGLCLGQAVVP